MNDPLIFRYTLVLVEDCGDDERLSLRGIAKSGVPCNVEVVRDGDAAIAHLLSPSGPLPGLIVLDFHLPGLNGLEIVRELRKHERMRFVPIVIFSSLSSEQNVFDCLQGGANSFVQKSVDPKTYTENVEALVRYWMTVHRFTATTASLLN